MIALLAEVHLETLHRLAQCPSGTRVGVASAHVETAHNLEHSIASAGLPNITLAGASPAEGAGLERLVRRVDIMVCSTAAADRVRQLAGSAVQVLIDDRALDPRAIQMLAALLVQHDGNKPHNGPAPRRETAEPPAPSGRRPARGATRKTAEHVMRGSRKPVNDDRS